MMSSNLKCRFPFVALACVYLCGTVFAEEPKNESSEAEAAKGWYAFYHREAAEAYRFTMEPGDVELKLDPTPIMRWTNPLEEGGIHGAVYIWRHLGRP